MAQEGGLLVDKADLGLDCFKDTPPDEEDLPTGEVEEREDRRFIFRSDRATVTTRHLLY